MIVINKDRIRYKIKQSKLDARKKTIYFYKYVPKNVVDLLVHLYTVALSDTYFKNKGGKLTLQKSGSYRSAEDCYLLCRSYNIDITFEKLYFMLNNSSFRSWWCRDVNKRVYCSAHGIFEEDGQARLARDLQAASDTYDNTLK